MSQIEYHAVVKHDEMRGLSVLFTELGAEQITDERFRSFKLATGQATVRKKIEPTGWWTRISIEGYLPENTHYPLFSMWELAELVCHHFGINTDVTAPA